MNTKLAIFCLTANAIFFAACAQDTPDDTFTTGGGVGIEPQKIYVSSATDKRGGAATWRDAALSFAHGNATLRLRIENTQDAAQSLKIRIPLQRGHNAHEEYFSPQRTLTITAKTQLPSYASQDWDIPVPDVGNISLARPSGWNSQRIVVRDATGEYQAPDMMGMFGYGDNTYRKTLYSPNWPIATAANDTRWLPPEWRPRMMVSHNALRFGFQSAYALAVRARTAPHVTISFDAPEETPDFVRFRRWQDLSGYDLVLIDANDWPAIPDSFKALLPDWVAAGGTLATAGIKDPPVESGSFGLGRAVALAASPSQEELDALAKTLASDIARNAFASSTLDCDIKAGDAVVALRNETPFSTILMILLAFCILAGPVLVISLAKRNRRLNVIWLFPSMAVVFSLAVMGLIVCAKGIYPELRQFSHTIYDEKAGKAVTVCNHVILAPFTLQDDVRLDAKDSVVSYLSGDADKFGDEIIYTGDEFVFRGGWAPTLWPVVFRTVSVRPLSQATAKQPPVPVSGHLQEHSVSVSEERRPSK